MTESNYTEQIRSIVKSAMPNIFEEWYRNQHKTEEEIEKLELETLAILISQYCDWDFDNLKLVIQEMLTDSSFHDFSSKVEKWKFPGDE
jgi:hypothetical protein